MREIQEHDEFDYRREQRAQIQKETGSDSDDETPTLHDINEP